MTDEEFLAIRARVTAFHKSPDEASFHLKMDARTLLSEVMRLMTRERELLEKIDELEQQLREFSI